MDPVSAIGLASGILTFVEAGLKLVKIAYNIHNSLDGVLDNNRHRESVTSEVSKAALRLEVAGNARLTPEQESLSDLAKKCKATSTELVKALNEVKPKRSSSNPFKSLRYAVKTNLKAKDINGLENQLKDYRDQLILAQVEFSSLTQAIEHLRQSQISAPDSISNTHACSQFQRLLMVDDETRRAMYQDRVLESLKFDEMHQRFDAVHSAHEDTFKWIYEPIETIEEDDDLSLEDDNWSDVEEHGLTYEERIRREALKLTYLPDLIPEVVPGHWNQAKQTPWKVDNRQEIPSSVIKDALGRLLQNDKLYQQHKFCIFIDGLDEFEPGVQDGLDYIDLVNVLRQWTIHAGGNLKLCLSSREEGVFMDEYASDPSFRLQDLTRFDMQNYVRSRLSNLKDENLKSDLATEIPEKSSGIFLWTYLVVKTIRNKMTHRATSETLRKHLNTLPRGLEALFHHILQQLEPDDARKTLRIIDSLQTAKSNYIELPLLAFPLIDRYDKDKEFSLRKGLEDEPTPDEIILQAQLRGACGGLIECHEGNQYERLQVLEFVHRSVPDMFYKDTKGSEFSMQMEAALDGTNTIDVVSHLCFATFRLSGQTGTGDLERSVCQSIVLMRFEEKIDKPPYSFPEYIGSWANDRWLDDNQAKWQFFFSPFAGSSYLYIRPYGAPAIGSNNPRQLYNTMCLAALSGHIDYIEWKIVNDANALNNAAKRAFVGHFILISKHWEMFFEKSIFTMDPRIPLVPSIAIQDWSKWVVPDPVTLSAWQFFLTYIILNVGSYFGVARDDGNVIERFLRQGADSHCRILVAYEETRINMTICFRESRTCHVIPRDPVWVLFDYSVKKVIGRCLTLRGKPLVDWGKNFTEEFLLREWIACTDWPNKDTLLELLDCNCE
ncbi:hypothetical protein FOC4_g10005108 [Fusarium odoratissimum]|uniref:Fungal N-terminal domain-containing protein n=1 Tax=Fusarium oxysporum f. sp. cubense (strain race 4) TaxID=2502994 RepID=N1S369_FUSC4|nr:hypothetical protein FOC4_g10005108 [Fusarium odoratissimum]